MSMMLQAARRNAIIARARQNGTVRVAQLATVLQVSEMTIRRDIDVLADSGLLERVHGGATLPNTMSAGEPGFASKLGRQEPQKAAIVREALAMVRPGEAIGLSAGTTTWQLAQLLPTVPGLTVVTNSVQIAMIFYRYAEVATAAPAVILTGGERTPSDALVGPITRSALRQLHLDTLFLGVHGMAEDVGFTSPNLQESETDRAFIAAARRTVVLADHTKWGIIGMSTITGLSDVDTVVTDDGLSGEARAALTAAARDVRVVSLGETGRASA